MVFGIDVNNINLIGLMVIGSRWENEIVVVVYIVEIGWGWLELLIIVKEVFVEID